MKPMRQPPMNGSSLAIILGAHSRKSDEKEPEEEDDDGDEQEGYDDLEETCPEFCGMFAAFLLASGIRPEDEQLARKRLVHLLDMYHASLEKA